MSEFLATIIYFGLAPTLLLFFGILIMLNIALAYAVFRLSRLVNIDRVHAHRALVSARFLSVAVVALATRIVVLEEVCGLANNVSANENEKQS